MTASPRTPRPSGKPRPIDSIEPAPDLFAGLRVWVLVGTVGWQAAVPILLLGAGGAWLDQQWHTVPWLTLAGCFLALAVSSALVWRTIQTTQRQIEVADHARQAARRGRSTTARRCPSSRS